MQFIHIHRRASAIVAIALAATAVSASATSARVLEGPLHQTGQAGLAVPPIQDDGGVRQNSERPRRRRH